MNKVHYNLALIIIQNITNNNYNNSYINTINNDSKLGI